MDIPRFEDLAIDEQRWAQDAYDWLEERIRSLEAGAVGDRDIIHMRISIYWNALNLPHLLTEADANGRLIWQSQRDRCVTHQGYVSFPIPGAWARSLWNRLPQVVHRSRNRRPSKVTEQAHPEDAPDTEAPGTG
jgi:hypothetical protein